MNVVLETLASAGFAAAVIALLRKRWPALDGWYVTGVYALLAVATALLTHYSDAIPLEAWRAMQAVMGFVAGQGAITLAQQIATKSSVTTNTIQVVPSDPVVRSVGDLADQVLESLNRDTKPTAAPVEPKG